MADPRYRTWRGLAVIGVYGLLTLGAALMTTGGLFHGAIFPQAESPAPAQIPPFVYVFAFLGAMAYAFTSVIAKFERGTPGVIRVGLRAMAALPLAAGVFLLSEALASRGAASSSWPGWRSSSAST